jgi:steroid delta-isomerase-like uncharacterized protein
MATAFDKHTKDVFAAINAHDVEQFLSLHTDDIIVENVALGTVSRGKEAVRANLKRNFAAIPDYRIELTSCFASGDRQWEEYVASGTHEGDFMGIAATGRSFSFRVTTVRELREGKTCHVCVYYDSASLMRQLGVLPQLLSSQIQSPYAASSTKGLFSERPVA